MQTGYVAFLDVLGFSSLVSADLGSGRIEQYLSCLRSVLDVKQDASRLEYTVFSDSIIITASQDSQAGLEVLLTACSLTFGKLLAQEIPIRGAISHGPYVTDTTNDGGRFVAGRAIIEAYQFEAQQDWIGIMIAPSVIRKIPDLRARCLFEDPSDTTIMARLMGRMPWVGYVQPSQIPFHDDALEESVYDGFAIVPTTGNTDPASLRDSLRQSSERLRQLKSLAPDPKAQRKYQRSLNWLENIQRNWHTAAFRDQSFV